MWFLSSRKRKCEESFSMRGWTQHESSSSDANYAAEMWRCHYTWDLDEVPITSNRASHLSATRVDSWQSSWKHEERTVAVLQLDRSIRHWSEGKLRSKNSLQHHHKVIDSVFLNDCMNGNVALRSTEFVHTPVFVVHIICSNNFRIDRFNEVKFNVKQLFL